MTVSHIRQPMPRRRGNSFYRDKTDYSAFAKTLCGAPITDRDASFFDGGTKKFRADTRADWPKCDACLKARGANRPSARVAHRREPEPLPDAWFEGEHFQGDHSRGL